MEGSCEVGWMGGVQGAGVKKLAICVILHLQNLTCLSWQQAGMRGWGVGVGVGAGVGKVRPRAPIVKAWEHFATILFCLGIRFHDVQELRNDKFRVREFLDFFWGKLHRFSLGQFTWAISGPIYFKYWVFAWLPRAGSADLYVNGMTALQRYSCCWKIIWSRAQWWIKIIVW